MVDPKAKPATSFATALVSRALLRMIGELQIVRTRPDTTLQLLLANTLPFELSENREVEDGPIKFIETTKGKYGAHILLGDIERARELIVPEESLLSRDCGKCEGAEACDEKLGICHCGCFRTLDKRQCVLNEAYTIAHLRLDRIHPEHHDLEAGGHGKGSISGASSGAGAVALSPMLSSRSDLLQACTLALTKLSSTASGDVAVETEAGHEGVLEQTDPLLPGMCPGVSRTVRMQPHAGSNNLVLQLDISMAAVLRSSEGSYDVDVGVTDERSSRGSDSAATARRRTRFVPKSESVLRSALPMSEDAVADSAIAASGDVSQLGHHTAASHSSQSGTVIQCSSSPRFRA